MLESFRRRLAEDFDEWCRVLDEPGPLLVAAGNYEGIDDYRREVAGYTAHLLTTVAAMDGDISPDEMLAMLFAGMGGATTAQEYFGAIQGMQHELLQRSDALDDIPLFLERAADYDRLRETNLAASLTAALLGMAGAVTAADLAEDASERLFFEGYRRRLARFLRDRDLHAQVRGG